MIPASVPGRVVAIAMLMLCGHARACELDGREGPHAALPPAVLQAAGGVLRQRFVGLAAWRSAGPTDAAARTTVAGYLVPVAGPVHVLLAHAPLCPFCLSRVGAEAITVVHLEVPVDVPPGLPVRLEGVLAGERIGTDRLSVLHSARPASAAAGPAGADAPRPQAPATAGSSASS